MSKCNSCQPDEKCVSCQLESEKFPNQEITEDEELDIPNSKKINIRSCVSTQNPHVVKKEK